MGLAAAGFLASFLAKMGRVISGSILAWLPAAAAAAAAARTAAAVIRGVVAMGATMGFTRAGIVASSLASKMKFIVAIADGVAASSLVATLQSVGAAGLSLSCTVILCFAGAVLKALMLIWA